jgi:hypothetical protein
MSKKEKISKIVVAKPNQATLKNKRRNKTPSHLKRKKLRKVAKELKEKEKLADAESVKLTTELQPTIEEKI